MKPFSSIIISSPLLLALAAAGCPVSYFTTPSAVIPWAPVKSPLSVDQSQIYNGNYYINDRNIAGLHVINLKTNKQVTTIRGFYPGVFAPNGTVLVAPGPEGLQVVPERNELWVGDADGSVKVIDMATNKIITNITTGAVNRADIFGYDPDTNTIIVTNNNEVPVVYITVISTSTRAILGKIYFPGALSIEQPTFNSRTRKFYVAVTSYPDVPAYKGGAICSLNIHNMSIDQTFATPECIPSGIAFPARYSTHLFVGCSSDQIATYNYAASYVMDVWDGRIIANISGLSGIDQVTYSKTTNAFYAAARDMTIDGRNGSTPMPIIGVVDAKTLKMVQKVPTGDTVLAHAVSVDESSGNMVVPERQLGIVVYSPIAGMEDEGRHPHWRR